jgi:hypothetical protein
MQLLCRESATSKFPQTHMDVLRWDPLQLRRQLEAALKSIRAVPRISFERGSSA